MIITKCRKGVQPKYKVRLRNCTSQVGERSEDTDHEFSFMVSHKSHWSVGKGSSIIKCR